MSLDKTSASGYRHADYAQSFAEEGKLRWLEHSKGWVIERTVKKESAYKDAMGIYPFYSCSEWPALPADLDMLRHQGPVSLTLVTDPMLSEAERQLFDMFDVVRPFKRHYLAELDKPINEIVSRHHAYYSRRAKREVNVELVEQPKEFLDEWYLLYSGLIAKYQVSDMRAFSKQAFSRLFSMPGIFLFKAVHQGKVIGAQLMILQDDVALAHLSAFTDEGYEHGASYLLDQCALEFFTGKVRYINWGGGRGVIDEEDGLARYKRGWSTTAKTSYLLGIVFDGEAYDLLCKSVDGDQSDEYFPLYRAGEFGGRNV